MKAKKPNPVTQEDVQRALRKFRAEGRLITRLPDQRELPRLLVGSKFGAYEPVMEGFEVT